MPSNNCALCPRLAEFRKDNCSAYPSFFNAPVPAFGSIDAPILIVGLAPGLRGANQTGRPFTGDYAGDLLYAALHEFGFAHGAYGARADDGLSLVDCRITNAVRCVPPANKPVAAEIAACRPFLMSEISAMGNLRAILALGRIAHDSILTAMGIRRADHRFGHAARHEIDEPRRLTIVDSYHCSRYNTNTGRLTEPMFCNVIKGLRDFVPPRS